MVKKNFYDSVLDGIGEIIEEVSENITKEFKGANPFDKEPVSNDEMLVRYNMLTDEDKIGLVNQHGIEAYQNMVNQMEQIKARRVK